MAAKKKPAKEILLADCADLSLAQVAERYSTSKSKVAKWLKSYGTKMSEVTQTLLAVKVSRAQSAIWTNDKKAEHSKKMQEVCSTPEHKQKLSQMMAKVCSTGEYRSKMSTALLKHKNAKEEKAAQSARSRKLWTDTQYRIRMSIAQAPIKASQEYRDKISATNIRVWQDPEYRHSAALIRAFIPKSLTTPHKLTCDVLDALGVEYVNEFTVGPYNFDIFLPKYNILIEVQGEYWHSLKESIRNDKAKLTYINQYYTQYKLKYVWEHEFLNQQAVLEKIKYWLGLDVPAAVFKLSDLVIAEATQKDAKDLLNSWHYQNAGRSGRDIGAFIDGKLVGVVRFTNTTRQESATVEGYDPTDVLEVSRLCIHPSYRMKNMATYILSRARDIIKQEGKIECLISFADSTYNHTGAVYKADNWQLVKTTTPDYWYVDNSGWVVHKKTLWNRAKKMSMAESEYAAKHAFTKVWGKEKYKFIKVLSP